jgi:hypothetical protein
MAKNNQLNVSIGVDSKAYKAGWDEVVKVTTQAGQQTEKEAEKMVNLLNKKFEKLTVKQQVRQMENLAAKMDQMGLSGTKAFGDVIKKSGELKAAQADLKGLIDASRPDAPFKAMQNALQGSANAFAGVQGAMALFGAESEDTQKALLKVQAAMAFAQGFEAIDQLDDSFKQLNLTMKANPVLFIAAGVVALGAAMYALDGFINHTTDSQEALNKVQQKAFDATVKEKVELENYKERLQDVNITQGERKRILDEISKKYPEYLGQLNKEGQTTLDIIAGIDGYITALEAKSKAQAAQDLYVESLKAEYEAEQEINNIQANKEYWVKKLGLSANALFSAQQIYYAQQGKNANQDSNYYKKLYSDLKKAAEAAGELQKRTFGTPTPSTSSAGNSVSTKAATPAAQKQKFPIRELIKFNQVEQETFTTSENILAKEEVHWYKWADTVADATKKAEDAQKAFALTIKNVQDAAITNTLSAMSESLGNGGNIGAAFLNGLADFLKQFGELLIAAGVAKLSLDALITSIGGAPIAIAAGVALIAASSAAKKHMASGAEKFASGGMVNSPTFAMVGDNLNAHNNPEFILRRDQLGKMIGSGAKLEGTLVAKVKGRDMLFIVEQADRDRNR